MLWCHDPLLTFLKAHGYSVVRLPKADVRPLQVLVREGKDLSRLGDLATIMVSGDTVPLPTVVEGVPTADVSGQRTGELSLVELG